MTGILLTIRSKIAKQTLGSEPEIGFIVLFPRSKLAMPPVGATVGVAEMMLSCPCNSRRIYQLATRTTKPRVYQVSKPGIRVFHYQGLFTKERKIVLNLCPPDLAPVLKVAIRFDYIVASIELVTLHQRNMSWTLRFQCPLRSRLTFGLLHQIPARPFPNLLQMFHVDSDAMLPRSRQRFWFGFEIASFWIPK